MYLFLQKQQDTIALLLYYYYYKERTTVKLWEFFFAKVICHTMSSPEKKENGSKCLDGNFPPRSLFLLASN